jgi:ABC-2 type transport system permease protein
MSAITVYMRDMRHLMEVLLQLWFWLSPVVYSYENTISLRLHAHGIAWVYFLNPITLIIMTFQRIFYVSTNVNSTQIPHPVLHILPSWPMSTYFYLNASLLGLMAIIFLISLTIFGRLEGNFESEL